MKRKLLLLLCLVPFLTNILPAQIISTFAGYDNRGFRGDGGLATVAYLDSPMGVCTDDSGNVYIADYSVSVIRKVSANGIIHTIVGIPNKYGYSGDGGGATKAKLAGPLGVALDGSGNLYIADAGNNVIRKVTPNGIISTVAGTGIAGYDGDGFDAVSSQLNNPSGVTVDGSGNLFICDMGNNRIRKVNSSNGIISSVAGNGINGYNGDGMPATATDLSQPTGITLDIYGNLYISDNSRIRKVSTNGIISTVAGKGIQGYSGDGGPAKAAQLVCFGGVAIDSLGNLYIADKLNNRVRKVDTLGIISTIAGNGIKGSIGDSGLSYKAELNWPTGLAIDKKGDLYIADVENYKIRKITGLKNSCFCPVPSLFLENKDATTCSSSIDFIMRYNNFRQVSGYRGSIGWDTAHLKYGGLKFVRGVIVLDSSKIDFSNVLNGKLGFNWTDSVGHAVVDSTTAFILKFLPKNNFTGKTGIWFDTLPTKLAIDTAIGMAATRTQFTDGSITISDTPIIVNIGSSLYCITGCNPIHYQWYENGVLLSGDTLNSLSPPHLSPYTYTCIVTYLNGISIRSNAWLPVRLLLFRVEKSKSFNVDISWQTATEINVSHFNIQRSTNGKDFETITKVSAYNKPSLYKYEDIVVSSGVYYYRVQSVDNDGSVSYSEIKQVTILKPNEVVIYPNPAKDYISIEGKNIKQICISDISGRRVLISKEKKINISALVKGTYIVTVELLDGNRVTEKLVKL